MRRILFRVGSKGHLCAKPVVAVERGCWAASLSALVKRGLFRLGSQKWEIWCHRASYDEAISLCKRTGVERNQNPHSDFPCISGETGLYLRNSKSGAKSWPTPRGRERSRGVASWSDARPTNKSISGLNITTCFGKVRV